MNPDLKIDAVELVKAGPCARCSKPLEELAHGDAVQRVRAVEHHALLSTGQTEGGESLKLPGTGLGVCVRGSRKGAEMCRAKIKVCWASVKVKGTIQA